MAVAVKHNNEALIEECYEFLYDPLGFVYWSFDWGEGELADSDGPEEWQAKVLWNLGQQLKRGVVAGRAFNQAIQIAVASGHGVGKAHPNDLIIDTPVGRRRWGDLRPGDHVFGRDGKPTKIIAIHPQGRKPVFDVSFDDGSKTQTCAEHLWSVRHRKKGWLTLSTQQISDDGTHQKNGGDAYRKYHLPRHEGVEYPYQWVPVDPYTLGAWLGDGCRNTSRIVGMDHEVFDRIRAAGYKLTEGYSKSSGKASIFNVSMLQPMLRQLGIGHLRSREKYVPDCYRHNLPEVRAEVLRGLLDTDGTVTETGAVQFSSASKRMRDDVIWLCRSLGGKARANGRPGAWATTLTLPDGFQPFYIKRKLARVRSTSQKRYLERFIDGIEAAGEAECTCITVEAEDSLYMANDFIVTHNTALISWLILWYMATRSNLKIIVTANTKTQLTTKTWAELRVWHHRFRLKHWFIYRATKFYGVWDPETHAAHCIPWSKEKSEAFAGTHAQHVMVLMDEASAIDDKIWEVTDGAMNVGECIWIAFGNPTKNTGRFRECFRRFRDSWMTMRVDSRTVRFTNKEFIQRQIKDWGIDTDYVRIRVLGLFPRASAYQLIPEDVVEAAQARKPANDLAPYPLLIGVDPAWMGEAKSVMYFRQGPATRDILQWRGIDTMQLAGHCAHWIETVKPDALFLDTIGIGAGVYDRLRQLGFADTVIGVNFARKARRQKTFKNTRIECWWKMKEWLENQGCIPEHNTVLYGDLTAPEYFYDRQNRRQLESKRDMVERGLASPDVGDALALTFYQDVLPKHLRQREAKAMGLQRQKRSWRTR